MREIKFRAWDKITKSMFDVGEICWFGDGTRIDATLDRVDIQDRESYHQLGIDIELMQFTGLHDKKGNDIYEGDILKYTRFGWRCEGHPKNNTDLVTYYEIRWSDKYATFHVENKNMSGSLEFDDSRAKKNEIEVIGNIYENPELLEETRNAH